MQLPWTGVWHVTSALPTGLLLKPIAPAIFASSLLFQNAKAYSIVGGTRRDASGTFEIPFRSQVRLPILHWVHES